MSAVKVLGLVAILAAVSADPTPDPVSIKLESGLQNQYQDDGEGNTYLVNQWLNVSDTQRNTYNPDVQNVYHLFTRENPSVSQPMLLGNNQAISISNFRPQRRTVIIVHGWTQSATSNVNAVLVPAFLQAEDVNVFVLDWSAGASIAAGLNGPVNAVASGESLARGIDWIIAATGTQVSNFHLVGFSLGAHQVAVAARRVHSGRIPYITALDPGANMEDSGHMFGPDAAIYTEAIHTNGGIMGHGDPVAHSDFFPNGGSVQPGCGVNFLCNHYRSFFFFAETLTTTTTGFGGTRCQTVLQARLGLCFSILPTVRMGGLRPKTTSGIFHLTTNAESPFSP